MGSLSYVRLRLPIYLVRVWDSEQRWLPGSDV